MMRLLKTASFPTHIFSHRCAQRLFGTNHADRKQSVRCLEINCVRERQKCASLASKPLRYTKIYDSKCERNYDKQQHFWELSHQKCQAQGVMITHRNAYMHSVGMLIHVPMSPADRYLWTLPMFHVDGWTFVWTITAVGGTHVCLRKV